MERVKSLRYTLVTDGSSDAALLPILTWLLRERGVSLAIQPEWADLRRLRYARERTLAKRIWLSLDLYPSDLLFVHRDAEKAPREQRVSEIETAIAAVSADHPVPPAVCVVPIRMQEAWLLFDEIAIRHAAGNRHGQAPLDLPPLQGVEELPDPKQVLYDCLKQASGFTGRRLRSFPVRQHVRRVSEFIDDFAPLRILSAFSVLESDVAAIVEGQGWMQQP